MNKKLLAIGILASAAMLVIGVGSVRSAAGADGGTISGTVYVDSNMNGQRDPGEPPQASRTVNLAVNSDETRIVQSLKTGPDGRYSFTGLAAGENYTVTLASNSGDFCWDDGGYSSPGDETTTDADLWVVEKGPVSVSGTVFDDSNENGVGDPGESGLAGLVVDFRTGAFCVASATTDSRGNYKLAGMPQAVWELDAQWPYAPERTGYWEQTAPLRPYGEYSPLAGLQVPADLDLTGDVGPRSVDVGLHFLAGSGSISLSLFSDLDRDQVRDDNEPPADCLLAIFFRLARRLPSGVVVYLASDIPTCGDGVIENRRTCSGYLQRGARK